VPLAAGVFDLAIGAEVGFGAMLVAWLLQKVGVPLVPAIVLTVAAGAAIGMASGLLVVRARIDSFIATLGVSSILLALTSWVSNGEQIIGLSSTFQDLGTTQIVGLTLPFYIMLFVALVVWYSWSARPPAAASPPPAANSRRRAWPGCARPR
jgi:ribose transport system permease protein